MVKSNLNIVIAGGGTGGHLFPGIAIANQFKKANDANTVIFAGTDRGFEKEILKKNGYEHNVVNISGIKGTGIINKVKVLAKLPFSVISSMFFLWKHKADLVVGTGGYSSGPMIMAAWLTGRKTVIQEQNIIPGITNRIAAFFSDIVFVSFEDTVRFFKPEKTVVTGNPVRSEIIEASLQRERSPKKDCFTILVTGGSQGAETLNRKFADAVKLVHEKNHLRIYHQTGMEDKENIEQKYKKTGVKAVVQSFFDNMAELYARCDLVICRAGATTISEISAIGICSILIPYPHAADNHQELNAKVLEKEGASEMITEDRLTAGRLAERIEFFMNNPLVLKTMGEKSKNTGKLDAAKRIVESCYSLLGTTK